MTYYPTPTSLKECERCHLIYNPIDPADEAHHKKHHRGLTEVYYPNPMLSLNSHDLIEVQPTSAHWQHRQMYYRAMAYTHEVGLNFIPWVYGRGHRRGQLFKEQNPTREGYLITAVYGTIIGALGFRFRYRHPSLRFDPPLAGENGHYGLEWVWLAPEWRGRGYLARYWPLLRQRYGDFAIEEPITPAMRHFLYRVRDERLMYLNVGA